MVKIKTREKLLIEYRNKIAARQIAFELSAVYFKNLAKKSKTNSQKAVDAVNSFTANEHSSKLDRDFLKVIDEVIAQRV